MPRNDYTDAFKVIESFLSAYLLEHDMQKIFSLAAEDIYFTDLDHISLSGRDAMAVYLAERFSRKRIPASYAITQYKEKNMGGVTVSSFLIKNSQEGWHVQATAVVGGGKLQALHCSGREPGEGFLQFRGERPGTIYGNLPGAVFCGYLEEGFPLWFVNHEFLELTGYTYEQFVLETKGRLIEIFFMQDLDKILSDVREGLKSRGRYESEYRIKRNGGSYFWAHILGIQVRMPDGRMVLVNVMFDVSRNRQIRKMLQEENIRDELTGVYNRRGGERLIKEQLQTGQSFVFLLMDIDNFKKVNDCYGHMEGDNVLVYIAGLLKQSFRETDIIFRLGGDEFGVLAYPCSSTLCIEKKMNAMNERFQQEIAERLPLCKASLSFGGIQCSGCTDLFVLYREADRILYEVKRTEKGNGRIEQITDIQN